MKLKKLFLPIGALAAVVVFSAFATKTFAVTETYIAQGVVSKVGSGPSVGATVTATCNTFSYSDMTDAFGFYQVFFPVGECLAGDTVTATALNGSESGSNSGVMTTGTPVGGVNLNIALVNIQMVPEFGMLTGAIASLVSGGLFLLKKRM